MPDDAVLLDRWRLPPYTMDMLDVQMPHAEVVDWGLRLLGIEEVWKATKGRGIFVGVADTGRPDHPDLEGAIVDAADFTESESGVWDKQGHSTHVCGIIGARANEQGVVGVAPECSILTAKVLGDDGSGSDGSVAAGIDWLVGRGCHLINLSLGSSSPSAKIKAAIQRARQKGVWVIAAAGNSGPGANTVDYPGKWSLISPKMVTAVASIKETLEVSRFSSRGPEVDLAAPGEQILSTYLRGTYSKLSGTSMATPFVCGAAALILAKHGESGGLTPINTHEQLLEHLTRGHRDAGSPGRDAAYGIGIIDAQKWFQDNPPEPVPPAPPVPPTPVPPTPPGGGMTKDELKLYLENAAKIARFLGTALNQPYLVAVADILEKVAASDAALSLLLWVLSWLGIGTAVASKDLLEKAVAALPAGVKAQLKAAL